MGGFVPVIKKLASRGWLTLAVVWTLSCGASGQDLILYETPQFTITEFDLQMYLRDAPPPAHGKYGSKARVLQALSDLYGSEMLGQDASPDLLSESEAAWIAHYAVTIERVKRYLKVEVDNRMAATDWESEALERYLRDKPSFVDPERVTVRHLLIRTGERTESEALELISSLVPPSMSEADFEALVKVASEDEGSREAGGLMTDIVRGQTVKPFEDAAFALRMRGELSAPVVTRFGVHVIQLVEYSEAKQRSFAEVREELIVGLKRERMGEYRDAIVGEARNRQPQGYKEHDLHIQSLLP